MNSSEPVSSNPPGVSRRTLVKIGAVSLAGIATGGGVSALITHLAPPAAHPWRFFTAAEAGLVIELCEQIIPRDDTPGATDAGVIFYIDRQLSGTLARHAAIYRDGIEALRQSCLAHAGTAFEDLPAAEKVAFLQLVESGKAPGKDWPKADQTAFFKLLVDHTLQGFYGSPRHGGNRDYVSYKILDLAYPQIIGQNRYEGQTS